MHILRHHTAKTFSTPNAEVTPLATPSLKASECSVIRQRMAPKHSNPSHTQTHEEIMVMLSGSVVVQVGDEKAQLAAGDTLIVPAKTPHSIENLGEVAAEWLIISPVGTQFYGPDGQMMSPDWAR